MKKVIVLAGPTASGKSAFALELAQKYDGVIVNADSLQWFKDLPILTAQPSLEDKILVPHYLYGELMAYDQPNAQAWREKAINIIDRFKDQTVIFVGGTGLYILALLEGLSPIPKINPAFREQAIAYSEMDNFYEYVIKQDPLIKGLYHPNDRKRLTRALEVFIQTGNSLTYYLNQPKKQSLDCFKIYLKPEREKLYKHIEKRLEKIIQDGAIDEVKELLGRGISSQTPVFHALGAHELVLYLEEKLSYQKMFDLALQKTRNYAKRQYTWFNHQMAYDIILEKPSLNF